MSTDIRYFAGASPRVTTLDYSIRAECEPVETAAVGYVGERGKYDEPTVAFEVKASGVPSALWGELSAVLMKIRKAESLAGTQGSGHSGAGRVADDGS